MAANVGRYVNISRAPVPLASGQVLGVGEEEDVDMRDDQNKSLRDDGLLLKLDPQTDNAGDGKEGNG